MGWERGGVGEGKVGYGVVIPFAVVFLDCFLDCFFGGGGGGDSWYC